MNRITYSAGKVNVDALARKIAGLDATAPFSSFSSEQKKDFWAVYSVFRRASSSWRGAKCKTGKGIKLVEKFVEEHSSSVAKPVATKTDDASVCTSKTAGITKLDMRKNSSYKNGKRPWGRKRNPDSRSAKAMTLIGLPDKVSTELEPGSVEQKNYWRASQYLRGKTKTLNLIK